MNNDTKIGLIIQASWEGEGAKDAQADLGKLEQLAKQTGQAGAQMGTAVQGGLDVVAQSSAQTAVRMAALEAKARETAAELRKLGQDVAAGNKTLEQAETEYLAAEQALEKYREELGLAEQQARETNDAVNDGNDAGQKSQLTWLNLAAKINVAQQAYQTIARFAKMAYDAMKEGARIEAVQNTFASLASSIGETSDALQGQLRTAVRDTVGDMALMEGANRFISMGLASTGDQAAELATIATQLGLAFRGDAVEGMEEFALLLANQSIPRLDTFGISASRVRGRIEELMNTVPGMTRETAFMQATMEQARITMGKIGDQTGGNAGQIARLEASVANLTGEFKLWLADALLPTVDALNTLIDVGTKSSGVIDGIIDTQLAEAESVDDLIALYGRLAAQRGLATTITGTTGDIEQNMAKVKLAILDASDSADAYAAAILALGIPGIEASEITDEVAQALVDSARAQFEAEKATRMHTLAMEAAAKEAGYADAVMLGYTYTTSTLTKETFFSADALDMKARAARRAAEADREAATAAREAATAAREQLILLREEQDRLSAASGDYFTTAVNAGNDAMVTWSRTVSTAGGLTSEQSANLDELTQAYQRTQDNIRSLQGGTDGLGLSEEELNKKLGEQYEQLGLLEQAMGPLQGITAEVTGVTEGWKYNQEAINSELYDAADAAGASAEELALLGLATGQLSEAQAIAALKSAALRGKIEELGQAIANGMDPTEALNRLDAFEKGLEARDFTVPLGIEVEEGADTKARDKVAGIITKGIPEDDRKIDLIVSTDIAELSVSGFIDNVMQPTIDGLYEVLLQAETEGATTAVSNLKALLEQLTDKTVRVTTVYDTAGTPPAPAGGGRTPYAAGGFVHGGIPGVDSVPSLLMPGELVVPVSATSSMAAAMSFVSRHIGGGNGDATAVSSPQTTGGGDTIIVNTQDRSDVAVRNLQRWQRQKELARGF